MATKSRGNDASCPEYGSTRNTGSIPIVAPPRLKDLFRGRSQLLVYHFMFRA